MGSAYEGVISMCWSGAHEDVFTELTHMNVTQLHTHKKAEGSSIQLNRTEGMILICVRLFLHVCVADLLK